MCRLSSAGWNFPAQEVKKRTIGFRNFSFEMNDSDNIKFEPLSSDSESYDEEWSDEEVPLKVDALSDASESLASSSKNNTPTPSKVPSETKVIEKSPDKAVSNLSEQLAAVSVEKDDGVGAASPALVHASKTKKKERRRCELCENEKGKMKAKIVGQDKQERELIVCKPCLGKFYAFM